jgi:hypothetical protein
MKIFEPDDPLVVNGTYDVEGYTPKERRAMAKRRRVSKMDRKLTTPNRRGRSARSQTLPGLEQVRNGKLDNLCESIAEVRGTMNEAKQEEVGFVRAALQAMVAKGVTVYKHGGVELARVPGAEKLRVRLVKEQGDADAEDLEEANEPDDDGEDEEEGNDEEPDTEGTDDQPPPERAITDPGEELRPGIKAEFE